jgi:hypothetical protein
LAMVVSVPVLHVHYLTWLLIPLFGIWLPSLIDRARAPSFVAVSPRATEP